MSIDTAPALSYIIVTPGRYEEIRKAVQHLAAQNVRDRIEIVIVAPSAQAAQPDASALSVFHSWQIVEAGPLRSLTEARAAGVRRAVAPVVAFGEDHSFPQPGWAGALLQAHRGPWAVVGPVVANANPASAASWANYLIEYGHWMPPAEAGEREHLPGHNSAYKREALLAYGAGLPAMLEAESVLHWDLRDRGCRLYLEPRAVTQHLNPSRLWVWLPNRILSGRSFAGPRARGWPWARRLVYALGALLLPVRSLPRMLRLLGRSGLAGRFQLRILPALLVMLQADGLGRVLGYALGFDSRDKRLPSLEFGRLSYLTQADREAENRRAPAPAS